MGDYTATRVTVTLRNNGVCCIVLYLCKYTILSVVLLQDMLEGQLDLLLEFLHLHLLLEPGSVWKVNYHNFFIAVQTRVGTLTQSAWLCNDTVPLI